MIMEHKIRYFIILEASELALVSISFGTLTVDGGTFFEVFIDTKLQPF